MTSSRIPGTVEHDWLRGVGPNLPQIDRLQAQTRGPRSEEARGAELLQALLRNNGYICVEWSPGDDPPDLVFTVDGERWAVEVTRVDQQFPMAGIGRPGRTQSRLNLSQKTEALYKKTEALYK